MLDAAYWTARLSEPASRARVPGAVLGIWSGGQEILAAHGVLSSATKVPVTIDSLFQIGSITKIWTATMIMQLVDGSHADAARRDFRFPPRPARSSASAGG